MSAWGDEKLFFKERKFDWKEKLRKPSWSEFLTPWEGTTWSERDISNPPILDEAECKYDYIFNPIPDPEEPMEIVLWSQP